ncbi:hypothetical protein ACIRPX_14495 [Streptomyces sp. NPDC101225]|uniref:MFS transporter small subunit n=1 Tax=Streptomyces sp. NPDC101225 TaxID=3366135 RepID=UPI0038093A77
MSHDSSQSPPDLPHAAPRSSGGTRIPLIAFSWLWVGAPLVYGLYELIRKATQLFTG